MSEKVFDTIASGLRFPEGPIAMPDGSILLVEIERGTLSRVTTSGRIEVVAELGGGPNGAAIGPDGKCYICNNGGMEWTRRKGRLYPGGQPHDYSGGRIERVDLATGEVEVLYTEANGRGLRGPNDIVFDNTGGFWFTDLGKTRPRERDLGAVYYARSDGSRLEERVFPLEGPNGIGLSAEESELYVAETTTGRVWAYELSEPGVLVGERRDKADGGRLLRGRPGFVMFDSLAVDAEGHVCVATLLDGGITVLSPQGAAPRFLPTPDRMTTNICFGGRDLRTAYITLSGSGQLVTTKWEIPGLPLNF